MMVVTMNYPPRILIYTTGTTSAHLAVTCTINHTVFI